MKNIPGAAYLRTVLLAILLTGFLTGPVCAAAARSATTIGFNGSMKGVLGQADNGYAVKINVVVSSLRQETPGLLLISPGNMLGPSPSSAVDGGATVIGLMNRCGYDGMAVGPHDLFDGTENLLQRAAEADFPFIASNLLPKDGSGLDKRWSRIRRHLVLKAEGKSVLLLGIISPKQAETWIGWPKELRVTEPAEILESYREEAKRHDLVVMLGTMPLSAGGKLMGAMPWIDMAVLHISGSQESVVEDSYFLERTDGRRIFWSRSHEKYITSVSVDRNPDGLLWNARSYNVLKTETADTESVRLVKKLQSLVEGKHGTVLCNLTPYEQEHFREVIPEAIRYETNAEIAIIHSYSLQPVHTPRALTTAAINSVYPYADRVVLLNMPGKILKDIWTHRSGSDIDSDKLLFAGLAEKQGRIMVNGRSLDPNDTYRVATVEFLVAGYINISHGLPWQPKERSLTKLLTDHFRDHAGDDRMALYRANAGKPIVRTRTGGEYSYNKLAFNQAAASYQYNNPQASGLASDIPRLVGSPYRQTSVRFDYHLQIDRPHSDITVDLDLNYSKVGDIKRMDKGTFILGYEDKTSLGKQHKFLSLNLTTTLKDPDLAGRKHPYFLRLSAGYRWSFNPYLSGYLGLANLMRSATVDQSPNTGLNTGFHINRRLSDRLTLNVILDCFASGDSDKIMTMDGSAQLSFELTRHLSFRTRYAQFSWEDDLVGQRAYRSEIFTGLGLTFDHRRF